VSSGYQNPVGPCFKCPEDKIGVNPTGAQHTDDTHAGGILKTAHTGEIGGRVSTPVTGKCNDLRLKCIRHIFIPHLNNHISTIQTSIINHDPKLSVSNSDNFLFKLIYFLDEIY